MKKIYHILFTTVALFAFASVTSAQETPTYYNDLFGSLTFPQEKPANVEGGVGYNKSISSPTSDGTYWIKLEAFGTGEAAKILTSTPSDIILILDSSTSMDTNDYGGEYRYERSGNQNTNYYGQTITNAASGNNPYFFYYYYEPDDKYYPILLYGNSAGQGRNLTFTTDAGVQYFLNNRIDGGIGTTPADAPTGNSQTNQNVIWTGQLYTRSTVAGTTTTRLAALQGATKTFIDNIWQNDHDVTEVDPTYLGNRIAIITYDDNAYTLSSAGRWVVNGTASWFDIGANGVKDTLEEAVDDIDTHNWTRPDLGMAEAISDLLSGNTEATSKREEANLVVVMFTDGVPAHSSGTGMTFENQDANKAIYQGYVLKHTYGATLFTVGLIDPISTNQNIRKGRYFLDLLSSNYPESYIPQNQTNGTWTANTDGTITVQNLTIGTKDEEGNYYQLVDEHTDLDSIFDEISKQSGGSADASMSSATSTVDIVSSSFMLPTGATSENIKVFTDKCTFGDKETKTYTFEDNGILAKGRTDTFDKYNEDGELIQEGVDVDDAIKVTLGTKDGNPMIQVEGFDYSNLWCGPVKNETGQIIKYNGYKVIIMIPIKMNPDAVGGPNVGTNVPGSGIYINPDDDKPHVEFDIPTVSLPVNVYLEKIGLKSGESAKFRIERAVIPNKENWDPETDIAEDAWTYVSTVFVTNSPNTPTSAKGNPMVKVRGMPATITIDENNDGQPDVGEDGKIIQIGVVYRITEENWAWSYTILNTEEYPNPQYTVTSKVENPFAFKNEPIDHIDIDIRHAESKATNIFKAVGEGKENVLYDDSKPRKTAANEGEGNGGE